MSKLVSAMNTASNKRDARTANGAVTNKSSLSKVLDLFFIAGAARGQDLSPQFALAFAEDQELSVRLIQWLRDAREGAGERQQFRNLFAWLIRNDTEAARAVLHKIPTLGRWDDILVAFNTVLHKEAVEMIREALSKQDGLCAKWMPRKGADAVSLRLGLGWSPKQYRKTLVNLSNTVEQKMCANDWAAIKFEQVPSVAFARLKRTFTKHVPEKFTGFVKAVEAGEKKIHASSVFPYDIVRGLRNSRQEVEKRAMNEQWKALPNYLEGTNESILVIADSSGSMGSLVSGSVSALDVCISLAIYCSERLKGPFKDSFITFSAVPTMQTVSGTLENRVQQIARAQWDQNTNFVGAFEEILRVAKQNGLKQEDLPTKVLAISDMEFDQSQYSYNYGRVAQEATNFDVIKMKFRDAGYEMPDLIFWNVNGRPGNNPVTINDKGVALVSGMSPSIVKSVLGAKGLTAFDVMLEALMNERYDY